jgi:sugar phosphate isomerase/epimerase
MKEQDKLFGKVSRRKFLGSAAAAAAAVSVLPLASSCTSKPAPSAVKGAKPNSLFSGVQIGCITYSFGRFEGTIVEVLQACKDCGASSIELMSNGIETYLGGPAAPPRPQRPAPAGLPAGANVAPGAAQARPAQAAAAQAAAVPAQPQAGQASGGAPGGMPGGPGGMPMGGFQRQPLTPEQQAAQDKYAADLKTWRLSVPMSKFEELAKQFNDAGVTIHIVKWSPSRWTSDEEIDYAFKSAKAMGALGVTDELTLEAATKLAPFAEKNGMYVGLHTHGQFGTEAFEKDVLIPALAVSPAVMLNFDIGHFYGSTGLHPNTIIEKYKDRIKSIHLKDKTGPNTTPPNTNQVWGQGETPISDVLLKIKEEKLPYWCDVELEYPVAPWSNSVKEVLTCINYARQILI